MFRKSLKKSIARFTVISVIVELSCLIAPSFALEPEGQPVSFRNDVASILLENCVACHGPKKAEGGYRIDTFDELVKPGDTGAMPIAAAASGELLRRITSSDKSERMPANADALPAAQIEIVKRWLAEGAKFDGEKGSSPLNLVAPPKVYPDPPAAYPTPAPITAMAFSPDGALLVAGGYHELLVWNVADGALAKRMKNIGQRVHAIVFLPDQKTIAVGCGEPGRNGEVRLIDFESGQLKGVVARTHDVVLDLAVRPASKELAVASADGLIRIVNIETLAEIRTIASHADWVTAIAWSDDGARLASASRDKSSKVFDGNSGEMIATYPGHAAAVRGVAFLPDGKQVLTTGTDKKLHRWEVEGAKKLVEIPFGGEAYKIARGDGFVFVPAADNQLRRITQSDNKVTNALAGYQDWVLSTALHAASNRVAGGSINGEIRLWNATDGTLIRNWIAKP